MSSKVSIMPLTMLVVAFCMVPLFSFKEDIEKWVKVSLPPDIAVSFPEQPNFQESGEIKIHNVVRPEAAYMAIYLVYKAEPGQQQVTEATSYQYYLGMVNAMVRNAKGTLTDSASFTVGGVRGLDFSYTAKAADSTIGRRRNRVLFRKNMVYSFGYNLLEAATDSSRTAEERFMQSISVSTD